MTKIDDWKPEVGMEVFIVPIDNRWRSSYNAIIDKVAKKYFYIGRERFFIETKVRDCGEYASDAHCYRCEADYNRAVELQNKRREIERNIRNLTDEQVDQVYEWITTNTPQ